MNPQNASRDQNDVATLLGVSNADARTPVVIYADPVTHRLLVDLGGGGGGTVTSVAVATAHGFSGTVANPTTAPVITLSATPVGILQSDGTSLSAISIGTGLTFTGGTLSASSGSGTVTSVALTMPTGFTVTGSPITTNGTFAVTTSLAGAVYASGGAFLSVALAQGDLLFGSATNTLSTLAKNTTATRYLSNTGTTNNPAWSQVNLTNGVTGLLPSANINITDLTSNTTFLSDIANSATFISDLTSNVTFQGDIVTIINNAGGSLTIDLATQVGTSILPLANGGTGADLTAPGANTLLGWDDTDNKVEFFTLGSGLSYNHSTHTLSSNPVINVLQVSEFDDFTSGFQAEIGSNIFNTWGNFSSLSTEASAVASVVNHPGILQLGGSNRSIVGFDYITNGTTFSNPALTFDNDFDITILSVSNYTVANAGDTANAIYGLNNPSAGTFFTVTVAAQNSGNIVFYNIGAGNVSTAVTVPASGTWFKIRFTSVSGVITASLDGVTIFTGSPGFTGNFNEFIQSTTFNAGTIALDIDYVITNYSATR